jgi:hypothetical protein
MWRRWSKEYVCGLREQHRRKVINKEQYPPDGDAVIVHDGMKRIRINGSSRS